jgi:hypothetical protein
VAGKNSFSFTQGCFFVELLTSETVFGSFAKNRNKDYLPQRRGGAVLRKKKTTIHI